MSSTAASAAARPGHRIAQYAANARSTPLPTDVVERTKLHLLDSLAAIVSGAALEAGRAGQRYALSVGGSPAASILGTALRAPLVEAALANGMAAHADESDDSHEESQTHPGCGVVPAALVVGEMLAVSGMDLVRGIALGYEMTIRFARALGSAMTFKASSLSSHAFGPLFGAGYAAGSLMSFDAARFQVLLNYLAQEASGLTTWRLDQAHTLKSYVFAGMPASNGVKAAALVRSGFTGEGDAVDRSNRNMLDAICPDPREEALVTNLGERHAVMETDIKKYPVGYPIASPVAALEKILVMPGFRAGEVAEVRIYYHEDWYKVVGDETKMPDVNLRYCLAVTLLDGVLTFAAAHDTARMQARDIKEAGKRIRMLPPKPHLDRFAVRIEIDAAGKTFAAEQDRYILGRTENPMSQAQVHDKAVELMATVLGTAGARVVANAVSRIEEAETVRPLIGSMRTP